MCLELFRYKGWPIYDTLKIIIRDVTGFSPNLLPTKINKEICIFYATNICPVCRIEKSREKPLAVDRTGLSVLHDWWPGDLWFKIDPDRWRCSVNYGDLLQTDFYPFILFLEPHSHQSSSSLYCGSKTHKLGPNFDQIGNVLFTLPLWQCTVCLLTRSWPRHSFQP